MLAYECNINRKNLEHIEKITNPIFYDSITQRNKKNNRSLLDYLLEEL